MPSTQDVAGSNPVARSNSSDKSGSPAGHPALRPDSRSWCCSRDRSHPGLVGLHGPSPAEPRRRPSAQRRPSPDRHHTAPARGSRPHLRREADGCRRHEDQGHPGPPPSPQRRTLPALVGRRGLRLLSGPLWILVSCVSSWYWVNAAETHQTFHRESGMRYQSTTICRGPIAPTPPHLVVSHRIACRRAFFWAPI